MPTKTKDDDVRFKTAEELMAGINKKYGPGTMVMARDVPKYERITTGSLSLDIMLGGGWPVNQHHEIIGEFSSAKTALALQTVAANQELDPEFLCLWIAAEDWDAEWAEQNGVDLDRVYVLESNIMEEVQQIILNFMDERAVDLIVLDSLPALIPSEEDDKLMEEFTVGRGALLNNKFFRKSGKSLKRSLIKEERACTCLVINQWREKIGVTHGDNRTTPGGKGKDFAYYTRVETRRAGWIDIPKPGDGKETIGIEVAMRTIKNKSAPNHRAATVDFYFDGPLAGSWDKIKDMAATAIYMGVINKGGGGIYTFGDFKVKGIDNLAQALREDVGMQREVREQTLKVLGNKSTDPRVQEDTDDGDD